MKPLKQIVFSLIFTLLTSVAVQAIEEAKPDDSLPRRSNRFHIPTFRKYGPVDEESGIASPRDIEREIRAREALEGPKYSQVKRLSPYEVAQQLREFTGTPDTWRYNTTLLERLKSYLPFKMKTTMDEERINLSYIHSRKNPQSLQQLVMASQNSQFDLIRGIVVNIQGDKAITRDSFAVTPGQDLKSLLFFYKTLEAGDTGLETKKFQDFSLAFENLAFRIKNGYENAVKLSLPMILEFESSALSSKSPITRLLYTTIVDDKSHVLKVEPTPDGGRLVSIHPFYAAEVAQNVELFADQFSKKVKTLRGNLFKDPEAKQRLMELLRDGKGLSGVLYTDERILELVLQEKKKVGQNTCAKLFR
jgi:hypothetical protein